MIRRGVLFGILALVIGLPLAAPGQTMFTAALDGNQVNPPPTTDGTGTAWVMLSPDMKTLTYSVTYANLTSARTSAHFHVAPPGVEGPVVHPIAFSGTTAYETWTDVPDSVVRLLMRSLLYVNIHSANYPAGEIRGQLTPVTGIGFSMRFDSAAATITTNGSGTGWAVLDSSGYRLRYQITVGDLDSSITIAHFHHGAPGVEGPPVYPLVFLDSTSASTWVPVPDSLITELLRGNIYANVHTAAYPNGEVRAQLERTGPVTFIFSMDGNQEAPPVTTPAKGTGWAVLSADLTSLHYGMTYAGLSSSRTGAHFHAAPVGTAGPVAQPINFTGQTATGTWSGLADSVLRDLVQQRIYANVHSSTNPAGEIRGQLLVVPGIPFTITMTGAEHNPPVNTQGGGSGWAYLDTANVRFRLTVGGLSDITGGAFHAGGRGSNGPVIVPFLLPDSTLEGTLPLLPDSVLAPLFRSEIYVNISTSAYPNGEIRGQLVMPSATVTSVEEIPGDLPTSFTLMQNYPNPFNPSTTIEFALPSSGPVVLKVYNLLGQEVATLLNGVQQAGTYRVTFDGSKMATGVYMYRLTSSGATLTKKMLLVK